MNNNKSYLFNFYLKYKKIRVSSVLIEGIRIFFCSVFFLLFVLMTLSLEILFVLFNFFIMKSFKFFYVINKQPVIFFQFFKKIETLLLLVLCLRIIRSINNSLRCVCLKILTFFLILI